MIIAADENRSHMRMGMYCTVLHNFVVCQDAAAAKPMVAVEDTRIDYAAVLENQQQECRIDSLVVDVDL